jgi:cytidylate kinase
MYRSLTWYFLRHNCAAEDSAGLERMTELLKGLDFDYRPNAAGDYEIHIDGEPVGQAIRAPEVTAGVSRVSAIPEVRRWLLDKQRCFAKLGLIVMEGRDIGTVVFPDAEFKFFVTASPEARARRRLAQAGETPAAATVESVAAEIAERDRLDSTRAVAPLRQAEDAELIDTTDMSVAQVVELIAGKVRNALD